VRLDARRRVAKPAFPGAPERQYSRYLVGRANLRARVAREVVLGRARAIGVDERRRRDNVEQVSILEAIKIASVAFDERAAIPLSILSRVAMATDVHVAGQTRNAVRSALAIGLPAVDPRQLDLFVPNRPLFEVFAEDNVALIKGLDERYFADLAKRALKTTERGASLADLRADLHAALGGSKRRSAFIARDQVGTLNAQITRARFEAIGVGAYIWSTSGDGNVRPEHVERDGRVIRYSDPPDDGHAGAAIGCRCVQRAYFGAL